MKKKRPVFDKGLVCSDFGDFQLTDLSNIQALSSPGPQWPLKGLIRAVMNHLKHKNIQSLVIDKAL